MDEINEIGRSIVMQMHTAMQNLDGVSVVMDWIGMVRYIVVDDEGNATHGYQVFWPDGADGHAQMGMAQHLLDQATENLYQRGTD